jgi:hypothetical protein
MAANGTPTTVLKDLDGAKKQIMMKKFIAALTDWDVDTLSTFKTSGLTSIQKGYHIYCVMPGCGCRDLVNLVSYLTCGDIVTTRERVDLLIEWGFISLTDIDFLREVLSSVGVLYPCGWSPKVFNHLFYKMDKDALGAHRYRIPDYPADMSIANALYESLAPISSVYSMKYMDYLFTECGYTVRDTDCEFLSDVEPPSEVLWLCDKYGCDPNKKNPEGFIPFYQHMSTWIDFDKPSWTDSKNHSRTPPIRMRTYMSCVAAALALLLATAAHIDSIVPYTVATALVIIVLVNISPYAQYVSQIFRSGENRPPHVYRDSLGLDIWHMFLAYVSAGMDVSIVDTDGHTMEDYFSHLTVYPGWDGPRHDSGSVLDWFLKWKAKQ